MDYSNLTADILRQLTSGTNPSSFGQLGGNSKVGYGNGSLWYNPAITEEQQQLQAAKDTRGANFQQYVKPRDESWTYGETDPNNSLAGWNQTLTQNAEGGMDVGDVRNYDNTANRKKWDTIEKLSQAAFGGVAGAGALGLLSGGAGLGAAGAAEGLGSSILGDLSMAEIAGAGGFDLAAGGMPAWAGSTLAGAGGTAAAGALPGVFGDIASKAGSFLPESLTDLAGKASGALSGLKDLTGLSSGDLLKLGVGAAGAAAASKGSGTPDYAALAKQQADLENEMLDKQTIANRPNQTNAAGDTSNWVKDPVTGQWTQKTAYSAANQGKFDAIQAQQAKLLGQIQNQKPLTAGPLTSKLDLSGIGSIGSYNPSPYAGGF